MQSLNPDYKTCTSSMCEQSLCKVWILTTRCAHLQCVNNHYAKFESWLQDVHIFNVWTIVMLSCNPDYEMCTSSMCEQSFCIIWILTKRFAHIQCVNNHYAKFESWLQDVHIFNVWTIIMQSLNPDYKMCTSSMCEQSLCKIWILTTRCAHLQCMNNHYAKFESLLQDVHIFNVWAIIIQSLNLDSGCAHRQCVNNHYAKFESRLQDVHIFNVWTIILHNLNPDYKICTYSMCKQSLCKVWILTTRRAHLQCVNDHYAKFESWLQDVYIFNVWTIKCKIWMERN